MIKLKKEHCFCHITRTQSKSLKLRIENHNIMPQHNAIKLFEAKKVRTVWDDIEERWYFSIVDVVTVCCMPIQLRLR